MLRSNYHTHTYRCGHADGTDEDYVREALGEGFVTLGFSDHIMLPSFSQPGVRGEYDMAENYYQSIRSLKEKYQDRIEILLGYEAEGLPQYFSYYRTLLENNIIDYLLLGNHFKLNENNKVSYFGRANIDELEEYKNTAIMAMATGLFSGFAHPDYFMSGYETFDKHAERISKELIEASIKYDVPLEINVAGIRNGLRKIGKEKRYIYPNEHFWDLVEKMGAKVYIGLDAHTPSNISDEDATAIAIRFALKRHLIVQDKLVLKKGKIL